MLSINTNLSSLIAQQSMSSATNKLNQAIERMTTGYKINGAKDNAANYSIATNMTTKINSYMVAEDNVAMGLDMLSTANGSLDQISDKLTRLRALATQASNGTYGTQSLTAINSEANALVDEINRIYSTAEYNGKKLFSTSESSSTEGGFVNPVTKRDVSSYTTMASIDETQTLSVGRYSISSSDELLKLSRMVSSGNVETGSEFVLGSDIDLSGVAWESIGAYVDDGTGNPDMAYVFSGTLDGNGYVIKNLTQNVVGDPDAEYPSCCGLFGEVEDLKVTNLGLEDVNIDAEYCYSAGIVAVAIGDVEISNVYINGNIDSGMACGLIGINCTGGNVTVSDSNVDMNLNGPMMYAAGIFGGGVSERVEITNCTVSGTITGFYCSGLISYHGEGSNGGLISSCTINADVNTMMGGGISGVLTENYVIEKTSVLGNVTGEPFTEFGGHGAAIAAGLIYYADNVEISNCGVYGKVSNNGTGDDCATNIFLLGGSGTITDCQYNAELNSGLDYVRSDFADNFTITNITQATVPPQASTFGLQRSQIQAVGAGKNSNYVTLQVGINTDSHSQIGLEFGFALDGIESLRNIGLDTNIDYLTQIDNMLNTVTAKATEYGAVQNRLESALDEIAIQYDNLVSSRSTLRDADIAEVSSTYIQQQILQQASATLLATANQNPSIALQLI